MKIALLGDIHGNLEAFEAVLADLETVKPDRVICTGDIVGYCGNPRECLAIVREKRWPAVIGNWEQVVSPHGLVSTEEFNPFARASALWTREVLTSEEREHLGGLPGSIVEDGFQVVHGFTGADTWCRYLITRKDARDALDAADAPLVFLGHTHFPIVFFDGDEISSAVGYDFVLPDGTKAVVNTGAVGQPRDKDPRAAYCTYDTETRRIALHRVGYDFDKAAQKITDAGLPEILATRLTIGN
jgi:diadenosine tetraphosphatase ApaH/serine/threonine PP2A family protein phosphatase